MRNYGSWIIAGVLLFVSQSARAQVPFFFPGAGLFSPEIGIVNTGGLLDMQATVSADRKYVTLNARPQMSTLQALRNFNFQQDGVGFGHVGDPPKANNEAAGHGSKDATAGVVETSPSVILARAKYEKSILNRSGMTRVSTLKE